MRLPRTIDRSVHIALAALLATAILCAQWAGFAHRIAHADLQHPIAAAAAGIQSSIDKAVEHSCLLLDSASLAASLTTPPYNAGLLPGTAVLALWSAFASWDAPFVCYFSSRAPPR